MLHEGNLAYKCKWYTVVLVPKGKRNFRGVGLVEVLWEAVASLLNQRLNEVIIYHDALCTFWEGRGTGTVSPEAKLIQHLTAMREAVLFGVFLDLEKAYDALDQERFPELIAAYRVGPRMLRLLHTYWD